MPQIFDSSKSFSGFGSRGSHLTSSSALAACDPPPRRGFLSEPLLWAKQKKPPRHHCLDRPGKRPRKAGLLAPPSQGASCFHFSTTLFFCLLSLCFPVHVSCSQKPVLLCRRAFHWR
ncbi:hypothetical protein MRX96_047044 [Rhipicephalus microplus]